MRNLRQSGLIKVKCDAHEWMHAWILELDHPYYATTGADGHFTIKDVPPGTYTFQGWFNRGVNNATYLYANCGGANQQVDIPITAPTSWLLVSIPGITVTGGSCELGFFVDASATDWVNADAFSFESTTPVSADGGDAGDAGAGDAAGE